MITLANSFKLKEIDWTLFGITAGIFLGVLVLACAILGISHFLKTRNEGSDSENAVLSYMKLHLTELVYIPSFLALIVLLFVGKFYISFEYGEEYVTNGVNFSQLIFGGAATLVGKPFTFDLNLGLAVGFFLLVVGGLLSLTSLLFKEEKKEITKILNIFGLLGNVTFALAIAINFINFTSVYDFSSLFEDKFTAWIDTFSYSSFFSLFFLLLLCLCNIRRIFSSVKYTTQDICEEAILVSLAVVLDCFVKFKVQAGGGSVGFAAIPLFIIAIRHGAYKGFVASAVMFGLITCMIDGYGFATYPFDYFIGFGGYCLVGLFFGIFKLFYQNKPHDADYKHYEFLYSALGITIGCITAMVVRYAGSCTSSMVLYDYSFKEAFIYNSTYIPFTMLLDWVCVLLLLKPILMLNARYSYKK